MALSSEQLTSLKESLYSFARYLIDFSEESLLPAARDHKVLLGLLLVGLGSQAYYWHKFSFWSKRNIKTPRPIPVLGNFLTFIFNYRQDLELEWPKKYGKLYGLYVCTSPRLVCADAAVLKKICIKDFSSFPNHHFFDAPNNYQKHFLIIQKDAHWRAMRAIMSPTFSSGRMKTIYQLLSNCADELCREHDRRIDSGQPIVDTIQIYGSFSMSSALKSFFGLNLSLNPQVQQDEEQQQTNQRGKGEQLTAAGFAHRSQEAFRQNMIPFVITNILPAKISSILNINTSSETSFAFFAQSVEKIIKQRQQSKTKYNDYIQLLMEARANGEIKRAVSEKHENHHAIESEQIESARPSKTSLTEFEVLCQGMMFMMVATETTKTLIAHTIYLLAHHPHIQQRLHEEVAKIVAVNEQNGNTNKFKSFNYDELISCEYLDCVVSESLRLMSPIVYMDRVASEDYHIEEYNVTIPKGTIINLAYYAIHNDPDYWPEPSKFDPDRFNSDNKHKIVPGSYCPFGIGPRACIGFRFSLAEAKVGIAKLISHFRFEPAPDTKYPPEPMKPVFVQNDFKDLRVRISRRSD